MPHEVLRQETNIIEIVVQRARKGKDEKKLTSLFPIIHHLIISSLPLFFVSFVSFVPSWHSSSRPEDKSRREERTRNRQ